MRRVADLDAAAARQELVRPAQPLPVQARQELGRRVAVEVRRPERVGRHVPARPEPEEVGQRCVGVARLGRQHAVDRRVRVVDAGGVLRRELGQVVLPELVMS